VTRPIDHHSSYIYTAHKAALSAGGLNKVMGKRIELIGAVVTLVFLACADGWALDQSPSQAAAKAPAAQAPVHPHTIGVYGDSLGDGVWGGLYFMVKAHPKDALLRRTKVGTGLTTPDFPGWMQDFTASLDSDHITNAVIMFGANDQQSIRDENHKGFFFKTPGWTRVYASRVNAVMAETAKRHIATVWIGLPIMRSDDLTVGAAFLNDLFAKAATTNGAVFLALDATFKGSDGKYATHLPDASGRMRQIRADDGVHFTPYGYQIIATKVYAIIGGDPARSAN